MSKRRLMLIGLLATCAVAGLLATVPASRHAMRRTIASHTHVRFSSTLATPVVPVAVSMPAVPARDADLRLVPRALADEPAGRLTPPRLDVTAFAPPTATVKAAVAIAAAAPPIDRTTAPSPATPPADLAFEVDLAGARQAMRHYHDGDLSGGDDFARLTSGELRTTLDWAAVRLQSRDAGAGRLKAFAAAHPDWPLLPWIGRRLEEADVATRNLAAILATFASAAPKTMAGRLGLARARIASGDAAGGATLVQGVWREEDLTGPEEASILQQFGSVLRREDHKFRADRLLYKESVLPALRAAALAGPDIALLARARAAVVTAAPGADAAIAAVPKPLQADAGLLYSRIQKARRAGRIDEAAALLQSAPHDAAVLVDGDAWWVERRLVARKLLDGGNPRLAYAVAAGEAAESAAMKIEGEFHAGWIALRYLDDPALAAPHFAAVSQMGETPISASRGAYWQARVAEAQGAGDAAIKFYTAAAAYPTTFYGQLAATKLGQGPLVLRQPAHPALGLFRAEAIRCVAMLFALGERDLAVSLALAIAKTEPDEAQVAALATVLEATGDARATLVVGKAGAQRGMPIDGAAFPTFGVPGYQPVNRSADRATVLAIARQESEFDPHAVSSAGAMGLMQLIGSTARKTAADAGIGFDETRLLTDAAFNARIGAAHLGKLLNDLDGSYILTFAAYNAGPGKVREWIATYGDPRKPGIDPIDWIERIPFTETRNYVQRVFENLQIYRAQLGMPTAQLTTATAQPVSPGKGT